MPLLESAHNLENNHHEGDKQGNPAQQEALTLLSQHSFANTGETAQKTHEMVKNGILPHLEFGNKLDNQDKASRSDDHDGHDGRNIEGQGKGGGHKDNDNSKDIDNGQCHLNDSKVSGKHGEESRDLPVFNRTGSTPSEDYGTRPVSTYIRRALPELK